jgi:hypothetical protein
VHYVAETFKRTPNFFHQLFAIRGLNNGQYAPLAFFLLINKHQTSSDDVLRYTLSEAEKLGVKLCPAIVHADYETAILKDVERL